jgi:hypothetical protein
MPRIFPWLLHLAMGLWAMGILHATLRRGTVSGVLWGICTHTLWGIFQHGS